MNRILVFIVGAILAIASPKFLRIGFYFSLPLWGFMGLVIGIYAKTKKDALVGGVVYGFVFSLIFMFTGYIDTGYTGSVSVLTRAPQFTIIGAFGPFCGAVLGLIGYLLKHFSKPSKQ